MPTQMTVIASKSVMSQRRQFDGSVSR